MQRLGLRLLHDVSLGVVGMEDAYTFDEIRPHMQKAFLL